jgi:hypothetical protein
MHIMNLFVFGKFISVSKCHFTDTAHVRSVAGVEHLVLSERLRIAQSLAADLASFPRSAQMQILYVFPQIRLVYETPATLSALEITRVRVPSGNMQLERRPVGQNGAAQVARDLGVLFEGGQVAALVLLQLTRLQLHAAHVAGGHFENVHVVFVRFKIGQRGEALCAPLEGTGDGAARALVQLRVLLVALQALQHLAAHGAQVRHRFFLSPGPFRGFRRRGHACPPERQQNRPL